MYVWSKWEMKSYMIMLKVTKQKQNRKEIKDDKARLKDQKRMSGGRL